MARQTRASSSHRATQRPKMVDVNGTTASGRRPSKAPLSAPFYVAVDRQLKAGHDTYDEAEQAALAIKKRHPRLHVTVYEAKTRQHLAVEQPKSAAAVNKKLAASAARDMIGHHVSVSGTKH